MQEMEVFEVESLGLKEVLIKGLCGKDYIIREASAGVAALYQNAVMACTTFNSETGVASTKGLASTKPYLLTLTMFEAVKNETDDRYYAKPNPVSINFVNGLGSSTVDKIFKKIREISNLNEDRVLLDALDKAFGREDAPVTRGQFTQWLKDIIKEDKDLRSLVMLVDEERTKNSASDTTATSE